MKKIYWLFLMFGSCLYASAQTIQNPNWIESPQKIGTRFQLPPTNTYQITKNETGKPVSNEVLMQIHRKRQTNTDILWKVSPELEILVYSKKKANLEGIKK